MTFGNSRAIILSERCDSMKTVEAVRQIMNIKEVGTNKMADRLGKPARLVSDRLSQENISISKLNEMLRVLDYKIILAPRETRIPDGGYEVE